MSDQEKNSEVQVIKNGPLMIKGEIEIKNSDGSVEIKKNAAFCRCGASSGKPFCDGSHKKINFEG